MTDAAIQVFRADPQDAPGIAAVHVEAFEAAYRATVPEIADRGPDLAARIERWESLLDPDAEAGHTLVAEDAGTAVGFVSLATPGREFEPDDRVAEIAALYVHPDRWRQGIGGRLVREALDELARDGWAAVTLWVLVENAPGRAFYAALGFSADGAGGPDPMTNRPKMRLRLELPA